MKSKCCNAETFKLVHGGVGDVCKKCKKFCEAIETDEAEEAEEAEDGIAKRAEGFFDNSEALFSDQKNMFWRPAVIEIMEAFALCKVKEDKDWTLDTIEGMDFSHHTGQQAKEAIIREIKGLPYQPIQNHE